MIQYSYRIIKCPNCNRFLRWEFTKLFGKITLTTGLGPNRVQCANCMTIFQSEMKEWREMFPKEKYRYAFLSLFYAIVLGWFCTIPTLIIINDEDLVNLNSFLLLYGGMILALQIIRIILSNDRFEYNNENPKTISFLSWQTNLHFYGMVICISSFLLSVVLNVL